jgi:hypothetical protein
MEVRGFDVCPPGNKKPHYLETPPGVFLLQQCEGVSLATATKAVVGRGFPGFLPKMKCRRRLDFHKLLLGESAL